VQPANRRLEPGGLDQLADRRALATRDHQALEAVEISRRANLADLGAKLSQRARVRLETALQR
jgi:hypothetical protein